MTEAQLFLIASLITGFYLLRLFLRLAPVQSELVLKTGIATVLAAMVGLSGFVNFQATQALQITVFILVIAYIYFPFLLTALARSKFFGIVKPIINILYWTKDSKSVLNSSLAQITLSQGNLDAAVELISGDEKNPLLLAQMYILKEDWSKILQLPDPSDAEQQKVMEMFRARAQIEQGHTDHAEAILAHLKSEKISNPITFKHMRLTEARILAERGRFAAARQILEDLHSTIAPYQVFAILARAAEQNDNLETAISLYKQAYQLSPNVLKEKFATKLRLFGQTPPKLATKKTGVATLALMAAIAIAYLLQIFVDKKFGANSSLAAAAFLLNLPQIPESNAVWRYLSYAFLHGGIVHIGFNLWVLSDIGRMYEKRRNWAYMLASFVLGTIMGALLTVVAEGLMVSLANNPIKSFPLVGASGGILGIAGALLIDAWLSKNSQDKALFQSLLRWMAMITVFSMLIPNVSLWGHLGGFAGGMLWGLVARGINEDKNTINIVGLISITAMALSLLMATRLLFTII